MDSQEQQETQTVSVLNPYLLRLKCFICHALNPNINDENNNLKKENETNEKSFNPISKLPLYTCPKCEAKIRLEEKETTSQENEEESDRMIIVPETSSDDDDDAETCWCQTCHSTELDSDTRQCWDDLSHTIKCIYRATDKQFQENQFSDDISKAKDYVKRLTDRNPQDLFSKLESIVFEYVKEIRSQVLERFHTCSKTCQDVQLFISFLLDEYQIFIQAASNVSTILSYLEENYLKTFKLTWLLFNKHLYEKLIYMDRKIQHSMSTMIDLLQPNNEEHTDYSPAEYTQLLNRFLAFDEEMSEIACLYKDCQMKLSAQTTKKCESKKKKKKKKKNKKKKTVDVPTSSQQGSNGSSIGSGNGGDDESSISSFDDYLLDNDPTSSFYIPEDEQEELRRLILGDEDPNEQLLKDLNEQLLKDILESCSPMARIQKEIYESTFHTDETKKQQLNSTLAMENQRWIQEIIQNMQSQSDKSTNNSNNQDQTKTNSKSNETSSTTKKSSSSKSKSSHRKKENPTTIAPLPTTAAAAAAPTTTSTTQIPKKSIPADIFLPRSVADLSAKIQSVSFTAGTFGSITSTNANDLSASSLSSSSNCSTTTLTAAKTTTSSGQTRLSINLTRKPGAKTNEHGGQKIAEALFNELTGFNTEESTSNTRKKDNSLFKKTKQQEKSTTNSFFNNSSTKSDSNCSSSSTAYNNLDQLLRHAASNTDASEAALHSILSSFHSSSCLNSPSSSPKSPISSKTQEKIQTILAQQQQQQQQQKKNLTSTTNNSKHCEYCCCDYSEGRSCSTSSTCLHLSSNSTNGPITSCVTCMALPGSTTSTTTSVMGATIAGAFNPRDVEMKERLKLKLSKKKGQNLNEQQDLVKEQQKKIPITNKKQTVQTNQTKPKEILVNDKNDIDDLVRFIDGNQSSSSNNHNEHQTTTNQDATSKKNKKKKDKQSKANNTNNNTNVENKNKKKQNDSNINQSTTNSQQASRSPSSSSSITKVTTVSNLPPPTAIESQQPLSKRKQKAKQKLEQQQKQAANSVVQPSNETVTTTAPVSVPPPPVSLASSTSYSSSSQGTNTARTSVDLPFESIDSPAEEEEVNWITISRKQSKHKSAPTSVPSLLAAPIPPVVSSANNKRQPTTTTNNTKKPTFVQPKAEPVSTTSKQQYHQPPPPSTAAPSRLQNVLKNHTSYQPQKVEPSSNLWMGNNVHHESIPPSPATPPLLPSNKLVAASSSSSSVLSEGLATSNYWDPNGYFLPTSSQSTIIPPIVPGPVQRPSPLFSPAHGQVNNHPTVASRCIQRPSPEPRSSSANSIPFPLYSPMNYAVGSNSTSTWNDTPVANTHDSQWNYSQIEQPQIGLSTTNVNDFPLYDPFHSGAGLTNGFSEHFGELYGVPQENDINEMDALDKEIENFKKFCFESAPLEPRKKVQVNSDRCFIRQS